MLDIRHATLTDAADTARQAPSVFNTQPWSFTVDANSLELRRDRDRQLTTIDPDGHLQLLSCGIAWHHAVVALHAAGFAVHIHRWVEHDEDTLLARLTVSPGRPVSDDDRAMLDATRTRRSDRRPFTAQPVSLGDIAVLIRAAAGHGVHLHPVRPDQTPTLAIAVARAAQAADPGYRNELMRWTNRPPWSQDGVPADTAVTRVARRVPVRDFLIAPNQGRPVRPGGDRGAVYLVLHGPHDDAAAWFAAGEAASAVLLTATALGLATAIMSEVIEEPHPRELLRDLMPDHGQPYLVIRCGHADPTPGSDRAPRRTADDVIHHQGGWAF